VGRKVRGDGGGKGGAFPYLEITVGRRETFLSQKTVDSCVFGH